MAKNRGNKKRSGAITIDVTEPTVSDMVEEVIDASESGAQKQAPSMLNIKKFKKGRPMKRSKNV